MGDIPFLKSAYAFHEIASSLVFWICDCEDGDFGQGMLEYGLEMGREIGKGVVAALCNRKVSVNPSQKTNKNTRR